MGEQMDTHFRMSRILPFSSLHLITALNISLSIHVGHDRVMKLDEEWKDVYPAFVRVLQDKFTAMQNLRAVIYLDGFRKRWSMPAQEGDQIICPWEALAASREWKLLDLQFPWGQINFFEPRANAQERYPD
ncbi:hypothetical protein N7474_010415 [Penicillium riverlandense]|uniref:uncharacterized protein n=1 Tax=Penicillium riverlandense TaxID=1903569 RepID=UPI002549B24C|nr:uncharacterized protein N7474_010415 [Penicillium riverlandense]KAJ5806823.1 hypothetical protein N7474_010415 [Penicillium riverlandense]